MLGMKQIGGKRIRFPPTRVLFVIYISAFSNCISSADSPVISKTVASFIPFASIFLAVAIGHLAGFILTQLLLGKLGYLGFFEKTVKDFVT